MCMVRDELCVDFFLPSEYPDQHRNVMKQPGSAHLMHQDGE